MSDWELERGLASSLGFDDDRRTAANLILRERYAGTERRVALWILAIAVGAGVIVLLDGYDSSAGVREFNLPAPTIFV